MNINVSEELEHALRAVHKNIKHASDKAEIGQ